MIVDTSAIMAIALEESDADALLGKISAASTRRISAGTWIELGTVVARNHLTKAQLIDALLQRLNLTVEAVTAEQALIGRNAYRIYGRGTHHKARLNFGDCFAYALAKATGEPLLFKGDDFVHTDIAAA